VVNLAWPTWWSEDAESSPSARAELRFALARKLGLDAQALLEDDEPRFVWKVASFKHLSATSAAEREAIISYGTSLARTILSAVPERPAADLGAVGLRSRLLADGPFVSLPDLLSFCWAIGVPVIHLKVFPLKAKRMCAMTVRVLDRHAILLAKESKFPAQLAYYVAHELGHIALGHLASNPAVIDFKDPLRAGRGADPEETAADRYALELLTGDPEPQVATEARTYSAAALAKAVLETAPEVRVEAGMLALCFGHFTRRWDKVTAALRQIYPQNASVGPYINKVAFSQIAGGLSDENDEYIRAATGDT